MLALQIELPNLSATQHLGALLADELAAGDIISLSGPLGAGKSALARSIILSANPNETDVPRRSRWFKLMSWQIKLRYGILIFIVLKTLKMPCNLGSMMLLLMQSA